MQTEVTTTPIEKVEFQSREALRNWLQTHHTQLSSIWAVTYKKAVPDKYVSREDVLNEVLCFGWIDGATRKLDDQRTMQLISPRRTHIWARTYQLRAQQLIDQKQMQKSGLDAINLAKQLGHWDAHASVDDLVIPADLHRALSEVPHTLTVFERFPPSYRRNVLRWIEKAKTDETRRKRIRDITECTAKGERIRNL
jgi:uncharacterized protein YdeI (YjbR/CyaY-like superfamily)